MRLQSMVLSCPGWPFASITGRVRPFLAKVFCRSAASQVLRMAEVDPGCIRKPRAWRTSPSQNEIEPSSHRNPIHERAIVEAFPNLFLGTLCDEKDYPEQPDNPRGWTDTLYPKLHRQLERLLASLLPGRTTLGDGALTDHEDIASFTCALTALCVAADAFTAVESDEDGWILLPPRPCLGSGWESTLINSWVAVLRRFPGARILW